MRVEVVLQELDLAHRQLHKQLHRRLQYPKASHLKIKKELGYPSASGVLRFNHSRSHHQAAFLGSTQNEEGIQRRFASYERKEILGAASRLRRWAYGDMVVEPHRQLREAKRKENRLCVLPLKVNSTREISAPRLPNQAKTVRHQYSQGYPCFISDGWTSQVLCGRLSYHLISVLSGHERGLRHRFLSKSTKSELLIPMFRSMLSVL
jgi:hypothetical protein